MLLTYILTIFVPLLWCGNCLIKNELNKTSFFNKDYTTMLKGFACLIVIYVHIHSGYSNSLQDAIGSFGFVCVTFFFLVSAYGMMMSAERKADYLKYFWRNRLVALLIPCLLINLVSFCLSVVKSGSYPFFVLYKINAYVLVLLQWCFWFYIVQYCKNRWFADKTMWSDGLLIAGVTISSLLVYFFMEGDNFAIGGWPFERMGLVWGLLLYRYFDKCIAWMEQKRWVKVMALTLLSGLLGVAYLKYKMVFFWGAYLLKIVLGIALLALIFTTTSNRHCKNRFCLWLGNISYEVYLSHGIVMSALVYWLPEGINSGLFILLTIVITVVLSSIVHIIGNPISSFFRKSFNP